MRKGTLRTVEGDVTNPQRETPNEIVIIPHCCNNRGIMGAGVALSLRTKWPLVFGAYKMGGMELGSVSLAHVISDTSNNPQTIVANMIGQDGTVSSNNPKPVKYLALARAMHAVLAFCDDNFVSIDKPVIHAPKFGSDLAGGNWDFILELIREIWLEQGINVVIYEFVPTK